MGELSKRTIFYIVLISLVGIFLFFFSFNYIESSDLPKIIFFIALGAVADSLPIRISKTLFVSVSFAVSIATVLVFKSPIVVFIGILSILFHIVKVNGKLIHLFNFPIYKTIFNVSSRGILAFVAFKAYEFLSGIFSSIAFYGFNIPGILGMILCYVVIDVLLFSILISLLQDKSLLVILSEELWSIINFLAIAPLGVILAVLYNWEGAFPVILFFGPLLLARYSFKLYLDAKSALQDTIQVLSHAMDAKDHYTNGHSHRVAEMAEAIGRDMKLSEKRIEKLASASILHDIGKIGVEDIILNKTTSLISLEFDKIKEHPEIGAKILEQVHNLAEVARIVRYHHVHYDGGGYPEVPKGETVPVESYIISVSDAYDAMTSNRPYRVALTEAEALKRLQEGSGTQFHPEVVASFLKYTLTNQEIRSYVS